LIEAFDEIKGVANQNKKYIDFNGFLAAILKFKPKSLDEYQDDYRQVAETAFTNICEDGR